MQADFWTYRMLCLIEQKFGFNLSIAGSKGISFLPLGDNTSVVANALWDAPSFVGAYLPASEDLTKDNFSPSIQNCNTSKLGEVQNQAIKSGEETFLRVSAKNATNCTVSLYLPELTHKIGYIVAVKTRNKLGRGLLYWLENTIPLKVK